MGRNAAFVRCTVLEYLRRAHYVVALRHIGLEALTVIVILALVALFVGLRIYSVLGERTGHEQQPILKPADTDARTATPGAHPAAAHPPAVDSGDMAFVPNAGPGVRAILAADPSFDLARFLDGAKAAYRM